MSLITAAAHNYGERYINIIMDNVSDQINLGKNEGFKMRDRRLKINTRHFKACVYLKKKKNSKVVYGHTILTVCMDI